MKNIILFVLLFGLILSSCEDIPCDKCNGSGKVEVKAEIESAYELVDAKYDKKFKLFSGGYECEVVYEIKNLSEKAGNFEIKTFFIYDEIGEKEVIKTIHVAAGETKILKFDYKNKVEPDDIKHKIKAPRITTMEKVNCDKCGGSGKMKED